MVGQGETNNNGVRATDVQVLAFTGVDPIIPMSGGLAIVSGLAILVGTLRKRSKYSAKLVSKKEDKEETEKWLNIL